jgi:hypothetical protein
MVATFHFAPYLSSLQDIVETTHPEHPIHRVPAAGDPCPPRQRRATPPAAPRLGCAPPIRNCSASHTESPAPPGVRVCTIEKSPQPTSGASLRMRIIRSIQFISEMGSRRCCATFTCSNPYGPPPHRSQSRPIGTYLCEGIFESDAARAGQLTGQHA